MQNPFKVVADFEEAIAEYTGAPYAVAVNSCTNALFLSLAYQRYKGWLGTVSIPKRTYISVPMQIKHAGYKVSFDDRDWTGMYQLGQFNIWDAARRFTSGMYSPVPNLFIGSPLVCVSFHWAKILGVQQGGAVLASDTNFVDWAKRARFDGRREGVPPNKDTFDIMGYHCYMSPEIAAEGLVRLHHLPKINADLPNDDYPDLSKIELFNQ